MHGQQNIKKLIVYITIFISMTITQLQTHKKQIGSTSQLVNYYEDYVPFSVPYMPNQVSAKGL